MDGFLLIDKPKGITSQTVCNIVKKKLNINKCGHNGTLDPNTTGIMLIAINQATKCLKLLNEHDKEYIATIIFGLDSNTLDMDTKEEIKSIDMEVNIEDIKLALDKLKDEEYQLPPLTSAIKIDGKKLYEYQRSNIDIDIKPRKVKLYDYEIVSPLRDFNGHKEIDVRVKVTKGYYVRALARDLGKMLGGCAILHELRRTKMNDYDVKDAIKLDDLSENNVVGITDFLKYPSVEVLDYMRKLVLNGIELDSRQTNLKGVFYVTNNCDIIALYEEISENKYKPILIFK